MAIEIIGYDEAGRLRCPTCARSVEGATEGVSFNGRGITASEADERAVGEVKPFCADCGVTIEAAPRFD